MLGRMPERPRLYLVDAMSNIHRAYHAIQRLSTAAGRPTNAVYGFVTMLRKMLREHQPDYLAVAWDGPERTQRHDAYAEYKANRPAMVDDLAGQLPAVRRALEAYRIPVLELAGFEADDVIGTLSRKAVEAGLDVVIVTADKDMLQLVGPHVQVFHTGREVFLDEAGVQEFFGVPPRQVADVLALMGDSVDNVPGVPGVGHTCPITRRTTARVPTTPRRARPATCSRRPPRISAVSPTSGTKNAVSTPPW
jgi:DNA polymerase-1